MRKLSAIIETLFVATLLSCGGASSNDGGKNDTLTTSARKSSSSPSGDDASFSCKLDGKQVSGKGTDQNINAAFHLTGDNKGQVFFRLSDMNNIGDKLQFQVPGKVGATTFSVSPTYSYGGYTTSDFANYIDDPVTVNVTSISASRISGTFSGRYSLQKGSGNSNSKQTMEVTDGKFDIPFSTSAQWKQLYHAE